MLSAQQTTGSMRNRTLFTREIVWLRPSQPKCAESCHDSVREPQFEYSHQTGHCAQISVRILQDDLFSQFMDESQFDDDPHSPLPFLDFGVKLPPRD